MAQLNEMLEDVQKKSAEVKKDLNTLLGIYENLYKQSNRSLTEERVASNGKIEGFEDFFRLVQIIRRNRDIVGSMLKGVSVMHSLGDFKFVEEDDAPTGKPAKTTKPARASSPDPKKSSTADPETLKKRLATLEYRVKAETEAGNTATVEGIIHQMVGLQEKLDKIEPPVEAVLPMTISEENTDEGGIDG